MGISKYLTTTVALLLLQCSTPAKEEINAISDLNNRYNQYEFAPGPGHLGIYLNVKLRTKTWDTTSMISVYDGSVGQYRGSDGIPWVYLIVYDNSNNYLFTIVEEREGKYVFFSDRMPY